MSKIPALMLSVATVAYGATGALAADSPKISGQKMTKAQCETLWTQARAGATGDLSMDKATPFATDFKKADANSDKKLSSSEWMDACNKGLIRTAVKTGPAATGPAGQPGAPTSDRTPGTSTPDRTPGASNTGAAGTERAITPGGTSDRTPPKQ